MACARFAVRCGRVKRREVRSKSDVASDSDGRGRARRSTGCAGRGVAREADGHARRWGGCTAAAAATVNVSTSGGRLLGCHTAQSAGSTRGGRAAGTLPRQPLPLSVIVKLSGGAEDLSNLPLRRWGVCGVEWRAPLSDIVGMTLPGGSVERLPLALRPSASTVVPATAADAWPAVTRDGGAGVRRRRRRR